MRSVRALPQAATAELHAEVEARLNPMIVRGEAPDGAVKGVKAAFSLFAPAAETVMQPDELGCHA
ncbi:hypothetical protein [Afifella marina]|uniref:hypothetical protein n=1 Tax=Afifella marina TaxID=1080 RepID=UPI000B87F6F1|nr:hypothetical protein [Afifella marina]MBK1625088.1 hypothetical protein [Afifella marina DSM 2698]MBK1628792.1 hypothetical protein [Afifella marina]MBK5918450.1 hypothetical protein [Afifella marina]RAI19494.1 hypothetical protein CH311_11800 [Afifella marina DSM 2698]